MWGIIVALAFVSYYPSRQSGKLWESFFIRSNAVISSFNGLTDRNDIGQLWENLLMIEWLKRNSYKKFNTIYLEFIT